MDDLNGTVEGYAAGDEIAAIGNNISGFFEKIALYLSLFMRWFSKIFIPPFLK